MTSQSSKKRRITRQNTTGWTSTKAVVPGGWLSGVRTVLLALAVPMLPVTTITMLPKVVGAEEPASSVESSPMTLEQLQQRSATQRWQRLKSQYLQPAADQDRSAEMQPITARPARQSSPVLPIPEESGVVISTDVAAPVASAPELPVDAEYFDPLAPDEVEPPWVISSAPAVPPVQPPVQPPAAPAATPVAVPQAAEQPVATEQTVVPDSSTGTATLPPLPVASDVLPAPTGQVQSAPVGRVLNVQPVSRSQLGTSASESGALPDADSFRDDDSAGGVLEQQASRAIRRHQNLAEINPYYDRASDDDIRQYAASQIAEYKLDFGNRPYEMRSFPFTPLSWAAPNIVHNPLYFEDPALERYGHSHHPLIQPVLSVGRFGVQLVSLPYHMTIDPPCREVYTLGWYRPGECAPKLHYQVPLNAEAAAVQAGVVTGLFFVIP